VNPLSHRWSLAFDQVERANPAAIELMRLCAFLAPDAIPEELISEGAPILAPIIPVRKMFERTTPISFRKWDRKQKWRIKKTESGSKNITCTGLF